MDKYTTEEVTKELIQSSKLPEPLHLAAMLEQTLQSPLHGKAADCLRRMYAQAQAAQPAPEQYAALEQALTRLQKRYGELESKLAAQSTIKESLVVQQAPVQERVGYIDKHGNLYRPDNIVCLSKTNLTALFTTPPAAPAQEFVCSTGLCHYKPAAPDLQAELDATNKQVEILSDALAESRREVAKLREKNT